MTILRHKTGVILDPQGADPTGPAEGQLQFSNGGGRAKGVWQYKDSAWKAIAGGTGDAAAIKVYRANSDGITDFTIKSINDVLPDFAGSDTLDAAFTVPSSGTDALLSDLDANNVYSFDTAANSQYDAIGVSISIPKYIRGRDIGILQQYRTLDDSGASTNSDWRLWVWDATNGKQTTGVTTGATAAGTSIEVASSTGMAVGDKIWVGNNSTVTETHISAIADGTHVTLTDAVTLASGDRFTTGILNDIFNFFDAADSDTTKIGTESKLYVKLPETCATIVLMWQQWTSQTDATLFFDNVLVTSDPFYKGTTIANTEAVAWTPTGSWTANSTYTGMWERNGDVGKYWVKIALAGAPTSASLTINLPTGHIIDTTKILGTTAGVSHINGTCIVYDAAPESYQGLIRYSSTSAVAIFKDDGDGTVSAVTQAAPMTFAAGDSVEVYFEVPISGWKASNQSILTPSLTALDQQTLSYSAASNGVQDRAAEVRFAATLTNANCNNSNIFDIVDDSANTRTQFVFKRKAIASVTWSTPITTAGYAAGIFKNGTCVSIGNPASTNTYTSEVAAELNMVPGDYITVGASNGAGAAGDSIVNAATVFFLNISTDIVNSEKNTPIYAFPTVTYGQNAEEYQAYDYSAHGSTNTYVPVAGTVISNTITNLGTITNSATAGITFTASRKCKATTSFSYSTGAATMWIGIVKNGVLTAAMSNASNDGKRLCAAQSPSGGSASCGCSTILNPGDVLAPITDETSGGDGTNYYFNFSLLVEPEEGQINQAAIIAQPSVEVSDEYVANTAAYAKTEGAWTTHILQTLRGDIAAVGVTLATNQITLPAGKYDVTGFDQSFINTATNGYAGLHTRLYDITNSKTLALGTCSLVYNTTASNMMIYSFMNASIILPATTVIAFQYYAQEASGAHVHNAYSRLNVVENEKAASLVIKRKK